MGIINEVYKGDIVEVAIVMTAEMKAKLLLLDKFPPILYKRETIDELGDSHWFFGCNSISMDVFNEISNLEKSLKSITSTKEKTNEPEYGIVFLMISDDQITYGDPYNFDIGTVSFILSPARPKE